MNTLIFAATGFLVIVLAVYYKYFVHLRYYVTPNDANTARKLVVLGLKRQFRTDSKNEDHEVYRVTMQMMKEFSSDPQMLVTCWSRKGTGRIVRQKKP